MPHIAKLFVQDEDGNVVGTFVVDMETIVEMYHRRMRMAIQEEDAVAPPAKMKTGLVRRISKGLGWYRNDDGVLDLREIPLDDQLPDQED